jgi:putative endonuclease
VNRLEAERRGRKGEGFAALWLRLHGWRIVARRVKTPRGEIDLVARRGGTLAFIEVKQRIDSETATLSLAPQQRARLARAAGLFVAQRPKLAGLTLRFDLMAFGRMGRPVHIKDAWRPESG